jgi:Bacterial Ig-like domain (group 2)
MPRLDLPRLTTTDRVAERCAERSADHSADHSDRAPLWVLAPLLAALTACGSGGNAPDVVVTISPTSASVAAGQTVQFTATVSGSGNTKINWSASGGNISGNGLFTAPALGGGYTVRATADANAKDSATGLVNVMGSDSVLPEPFYESGKPYVQVMTPMPFATYFAPATIRVWAHAPDQGDDNKNDGFSPHVDFYLGTMMVGGMDAKAGAADYYQLDIPNVAAGTYELSVRSVLKSGTVESFHVPVKVIDRPSGAGITTMTLTSDLVLSGNMSFELIGTADKPAVLTSSNGSVIRSADGWTGHLKIQHADIIGLGAMDKPGINVTVGGSNTLEISDSIFDACGPPQLGASGQATIAFNRNTLQPSTLTTVNDQPDYGGSNPSLVFTGSSNAAKTFQGNNIGVSFVRFDHSSNWTVGGGKDADGNILIGVRAGMEFDSVSNVKIQGNFSYHRYPFGWSQGHNLDFPDGDDTGTFTIEDNVFRSSSWMIQTLPGGTQFQYNLLLDNINEAFFRDYGASVKVHHNVLVNSGWQRSFLPSGGVLSASGEFTNNTVDAGGARLGWVEGSFVASNSSLKALSNNVFMGFAYENATDLVAAGAASSADHNAFFNPDTTKLKPYGDAGKSTTDVTGDPKFPAREIPFQFSDGDIWRRRVTVSQILSHYATLYTPGPGSPLANAGSDGNNIGAVDDGQFGSFHP